MQNPQLNHRHLVGTPLSSSSSAPTTSESSVHFNPHLMQYDSILPIDLFPYLCWFVANWPFLASLQSLPINFYHPFPMYCRESIILNHIPRVESRRGGEGGGQIKVQRTATNDCNFCAACPPSIITQRCGGVSLCYMPATNVTSIAVSPAPAFLSPSALSPLSPLSEMQGTAINGQSFALLFRRALIRTWRSWAPNADDDWYWWNLLAFCGYTYTASHIAFEGVWIRIQEWEIVISSLFSSLFTIGGGCALVIEDLWKLRGR